MPATNKNPSPYAKKNPTPKPWKMFPCVGKSTAEPLPALRSRDAVCSTETQNANFYRGSRKPKKNPTPTSQTQEIGSYFAVQTVNLR